MRILIFVVVYNGDRHITDTLNRISRDWLKKYDYEILVIDDASTDETQKVISEYKNSNTDLKIHSRVNQKNSGYGGNQKIGYQYALENEFDLVVLLHGDGQYAPEFLEKMIMPVVNQSADVVLGSRMLNKFDALKGRMPFYKWIGNQILTLLQNRILGTGLSEFHTGYRVYATNSLRKIPLKFNSNYFDFDTEILIQLFDTGAKVKEISIPTFYGDEISYVNGFKYAWLIIKATFISRLVKKGWINDRRFDYNITDSSITTS